MTHSDDTCVALYPYFKVHAGKTDAFRALCHKFVEQTRSEPGCLYYAFTFDGDIVHCREGYQDAAALLKHMDNVGPIIGEALGMSDVHRLEVHGPAAELDKLREALGPMNPQYFALHTGFRR